MALAGIASEWVVSRRKKKRGPAMTFVMLWMTRPLWGLFLPKDAR